MDVLTANRKLLPWLLSAIFFLVEIITLPSYGISWDETLHFRRGQAYLTYFLTGDLDYHKLPDYKLQGTYGDPQNTPPPRRSFYQSNDYTARFLLDNDSGHPPLNGELAALTNYIFFQKLGLLDDISAHHLFNIIASTLLIFVVTVFVLETFGVFPALISFLSLSTYPLFFSESHFNIKDPPEAAFFAATIWALHKFININSLKWLFLSFVFFALGLGTKFNIFFVPLILLPYILIKLRNILRSPSKIYKFLHSRYMTGIVLGFILSGGMFFLSWPYLWQNIPNNLLSIFGYYKEIGTGTRYQPDNFFIGGFNTFPIQWILFTTPPVVLILFLFGIFSLWSNKNKQKLTVILWTLWFLVPLIRVSLPGTVIYGGIRQVMEFLPAMAMLAGVGAWQAIELLRNRLKTTKRLILLQISLILIFIWPVLVLAKMHPNENVYFNFLIGGLPGAAQKDFPSWGNSFGNAYFQGIKWVNGNLEKGSKLSLIQGTTANLPATLLRADIDYRNTNWSGIQRGGEYLMDLTFNDTSRDYHYAWEYVDKFLQPVYELKVDKVSILRIWKNDLLHTKPEMKKQEIVYPENINLKGVNDQLVISLEKEVLLSILRLTYSQDNNCLLSIPIFVETSLDSEKWTKEKDYSPSTQVSRKKNIQGNEMTFFFAAREAKYIRLTFNNPACQLDSADVKIVVLQ